MVATFGVGLHCARSERGLSRDAAKRKLHSTRARPPDPQQWAAAAMRSSRQPPRVASDPSFAPRRHQREHALRVLLGTVRREHKRAAVARPPEQLPSVTRGGDGAVLVMGRVHRVEDCRAYDVA